MVERSHTISTAAAEIVALINSRAQSPWPEEIEAIIAKAVAPQPMADTPVSNLSLAIRAKIAQLHAAYATLGKLHDGPEFDAAEAVVDRLKADLCDLEEMIPKPPRAYADLVTRAELALYWSADTLEDDRRDMATARSGGSDRGRAAFRGKRCRQDVGAATRQQRPSGSAASLARSLEIPRDRRRDCELRRSRLSAR